MELLSLLLEQLNKHKKPVIITLGLIITAWFIHILLTFGFISTSNISEGTVITLARQQVGSTQELDIQPGLRLLPAGTYLATIKSDSEAAVYKKTVIVNNLLRVSKLSFDKKPQAAAKSLAPVKSANFLLINNSLVSYSSSDTAINDDSQPQSPPYFNTCDIACTNLYPYQEDALLGVTVAEGQYIKVNSVSVKDKAVTPLKNRSTFPVNSTLHINTHDSSFAVYDDMETIYQYASIHAEPTTIATSEQVSIGIDGPLVATSQKYTYALFGVSFAPPSSGDNPEIAQTEDDWYGDIKLVKYDNKTGKEVGRQTFKNHSTVASISASPEGDYFTINTKDGFELYKWGEEKVLLYEPQSPAISMDLEWLTNETFAYTNGIEAIYLGNVDGSSRPLFASKNVNVSSFAYINNKIYATGFYTTFTDSVPTAFLIDPSREEVNNSLIQRDLLLQTSVYNIGFDGETFTIYRAYDYKNMRTIEGDLKPAYEYINKLAKNPKIIVIE